MRLVYCVAALSIIVASCISDDFVDDRVEPQLRITNPIDSIAIDSSYQFQFTFLNNVGKEELVSAEWSSSNDSIITITTGGLATALASGSAEISAEYAHGEGVALDTQPVSVGARTVVEESSGRSGVVNTTTFYDLKGEFALTEDGEGNLILAFMEDYEASDALPGLFVYLSNNPSTISGALEIQQVEIFSGAHTYLIPDTGLNDYGYVLYFCKPFNVKVGHGEIED